MMLVSMRPIKEWCFLGDVHLLVPAWSDNLMNIHAMINTLNIHESSLARARPWLGHGCCICTPLECVWSPECQQWPLADAPRMQSLFLMDGTSLITTKCSEGLLGYSSWSRYPPVSFSNDLGHLSTAWVDLVDCLVPRNSSCVSIHRMIKKSDPFPMHIRTVLNPDLCTKLHWHKMGSLGMRFPLEFIQHQSGFTIPRIKDIGYYNMHTRLSIMKAKIHTFWCE